MLGHAARLRSGDDFSFVMRRGHKAAARTVVVYLARTGDAQGMAGFAVSRAVGGAVMRNLIKRRLRAIMRDELVSLGDGVKIVVRALPAAAEASFAELQADVSSCVRRAASKAAA